MAEKRCVTDEGYIKAAQEQAEAIVEEATIDTVIQTALALWQRNTSKSVSDMQNKIADDQMKMAEEVQEHAEKFWDKEKAFVDEVFGIQKAVSDPAGMGNAWASIAENELRSGRGKWIENMRRESCLGVTRCMDARWKREAGRTTADIMSFTARQIDARTDILNDRRYSLQYGALGLGQNKLATGMAYQSLAGFAGGTAASILEGAVNGGLALLGYMTTGPSAEDWAWGQGIQTTWEKHRIPEPLHIQAVGSTAIAPQAPVRDTLSVNITQRPTFEKDMTTEEVDRIRQEQREYDARWSDLSLGRI